MYRQAAAGRASVLGAAHEATLASLTGLAIALTEAGEASEAVDVLVAARRQLLAPHVSGAAVKVDAAPADRESAVAAATVAHALGAAYRAAGRSAEAEAAYRNALEERQLLHGHNAEETAATAMELAYLLKAQGRMEEGRAVFMQALAALRANGGLARSLALASELRAKEEREARMQRLREQMAASAAAGGSLSARFAIPLQPSAADGLRFAPEVAPALVPTPCNAADLCRSKGLLP